MSRERAAQQYRLKTLEISGGFLDGLSVEFSSGLNCIIGARGTGKSSVLEFVRYALGQVPKDGPARKRILELVGHNLGGGCIRLTVDTKDGLTYIVSRTVGEDSIVMDSKGHPTDISLASTGLFRAQILSQDDVETIAENPADQLQLLDSFDAEWFRECESKIKQKLRTLGGNAHECGDLERKLAGLNDELTTLPGIEAKLAEFASAKGSDGGEINHAHNEKAGRDRERRTVEQLSDGLKALLQEGKALEGKLGAQVTVALPRENLEGPNGAILRALAQKLHEKEAKAEALLKEFQELVISSERAVSDAAKKLAGLHKEQEVGFQEVLTKYKEVRDQSLERANLEKARNELLSKSQAHKDYGERLKRLTTERERLLRELAALRGERFERRREISSRINESVTPQVRTRIEQFSVFSEYQQVLERSLKGASLQHAKVAQKIATRVPPAELVDIVRKNKPDVLSSHAELNSEQARKVIAACTESGLVYEIECVELPDLPTVELLDGGEYKNSLTLSTGQKCTSILPILLLDSAFPLLVDQPEDNLDNRFIFTTVVQRLQKIKSNRQLVFITHNPNIPVLGDADRVVVLNSTGNHSAVLKAGTVDQCREQIVTILEGGEEAFKERRKRYKLS